MSTRPETQRELEATTQELVCVERERDRLAARVAELEAALRAAEGYMTRQRARSAAPFDPEILKQARAALAKGKA